MYGGWYCRLATCLYRLVNAFRTQFLPAATLPSCYCYLRFPTAICTRARAFCYLLLPLPAADYYYVILVLLSCAPGSATTVPACHRARALLLRLRSARLQHAASGCQPPYLVLPRLPAACRSLIRLRTVLPSVHLPAAFYTSTTTTPPVPLPLPAFLPPSLHTRVYATAPPASRLDTTTAFWLVLISTTTIHLDSSSDGLFVRFEFLPLPLVCSFLPR